MTDKKGNSNGPQDPACEAPKSEDQDAGLVGYVFRLSGFECEGVEPEPSPFNLKDRLAAAPLNKDVTKVLGDLLTELAEGIGPLILLCPDEVDKGVVKCLKDLGITATTPPAAGDPIWCPSLRDWVQPSECDDFIE